MDAYLYAGALNPIIKGAIVDFGNFISPASYLTDDRDYNKFSYVTSGLGCANLAANLIAEAELICLRAASSASLQSFVRSVNRTLFFPVATDNIILSSMAIRSYLLMVEVGFHPNYIPMLICTNTDEGGAAIPFDFPGSETATTSSPSLAPLAKDLKLHQQHTTVS